MSRRIFTSVTASVVVTTVAFTVGCSSSKSSGDSGPASSAAGKTTKVEWPAPAGGNGGATAHGVTATEIKVGTLDSATGPLPSVTAAAYKGAAAYFAYVNSVGGVYGRRIIGHEADDGFDSTKGGAACTSMESSDFAIVGSLGVGDTGCQTSVKSSGIPWIGGAVNPLLLTLPNVYSADQGNGFGVSDAPYLEWLKLHPSQKKVAVIWPDVAGISVLLQPYVGAMKKAGYDVVYKQSFSVTSPNLTPNIVSMRKSGADVVFAAFVDVTSLGRVAQAMSQQGWQPPLRMGTNLYTEQWSKVAGDAAKGWQASVQYPYLDEKELSVIPGGRLFNEWYGKTAKGAPVDAFAMIGWTNAALFVQGLVAAGPQLTSAKLLAAIKDVHSFDAGGLQGPVDVGTKAVSNCFVIVSANGKKFDRVWPTQSGKIECSMGEAVNQ